MSKGNQHLKTRIPPEQIAEIEAVIAHRNAHSKRPKWTIATFIKAAIREKIAHMERSRGWKMPASLTLFDVR